MSLNFQDYETVPLTLVANTSGSVAFKKPESWQQPDCMVTNAGSATAFVGFGNSKGGTVSITAQAPGTTGTLNATPILPGETLILSKNKSNPGADTCCAYSTGTPTLYFTSGSGS